jgi:uncharacterized membrane protein
MLEFDADATARANLEKLFYLVTMSSGISQIAHCKFPFSTLSCNDI